VATIGQTPANSTNASGILSFTCAIFGWVFFLILMCVLFVLLPLGTLATLGMGIVLYLCVLPAVCLPPLVWLIGIITGHLSVSQSKAVGLTPTGLSKAGLVMNYIGMGFIVLGICAMIVLVIAGASIPALEYLPVQ
jgi:hypothetical protein